MVDCARPQWRPPSLSVLRPAQQANNNIDTGDFVDSYTTIGSVMVPQGYS